VNEDFLDLLRALLAADARFLIVGAHALAVHGVTRATGDLDIWIDTTPDNAARVWAALLEFGVPVEALGIGQSDLTEADRIIQVGLPPRRIDVMTQVTGLTFQEAWNGRVIQEVDSLAVPFLGRRDLVQSKRAAARTKDLADLEELGERD